MVSTFRHWHTETRLKLPDSFPKESGARETRYEANGVVCTEVTYGKGSLLTERNLDMSTKTTFKFIKRSN